MRATRVPGVSLDSLLIDDVAFRIEGQFALQSANAARPVHSPNGSEFRVVGDRGRPDDQLLEAVFQASTAWMATSDPLRSCLIDRLRQLLASALLLQVDRASAEDTTRFSGISAGLQDFTQPTKRSHDASGLYREKYR